MSHPVPSTYLVTHLSYFNPSLSLLPHLSQLSLLSFMLLLFHLSTLSLLILSLPMSLDTHPFMPSLLSPPLLLSLMPLVAFILLLLLTPPPSPASTLHLSFNKLTKLSFILSSCLISQIVSSIGL